ncbi:MAG: hypothetical protein ACOVNU_07280, partial [Candidatus Kapaibacteriota bacterium]
MIKYFLFLIILVLNISNSYSQTKVIMKKGNEFICIPKILDDKLIEVQYLNGKIDTLKRKLIKRRVNVTLDIQTRTDTLSNVTITEIQPTLYKISQNEKLFNLNLDDVISINEHIPLSDTLIDNSRRSMLGVGVGLPFLYVSYEEVRNLYFKCG